jgi:hypothetical protein
MSAALPVDIVFYGPQQQVVGKAEGVMEGFSVDFPQDEQIVYAGILCASAQAVTYLASDFPVRLDRTSIKLTKSSTLANVTAATVGTTAVSVKAADSNHKSLVFHSPTSNTGTIYLGASGVTTANGGIVLQPGDTWTEEEAAAAAFFAIATAAGQSLRVQTRS